MRHIVLRGLLYLLLYGLLIIGLAVDLSLRTHESLLGNFITRLSDNPTPEQVVNKVNFLTRSQFSLINRIDVLPPDAPEKVTIWWIAEDNRAIFAGANGFGIVAAIEEPGVANDQTAIATSLAQLVSSYLERHGFVRNERNSHTSSGPDEDTVIAYERRGLRCTATTFSDSYSTVSTQYSEGAGATFGPDTQVFDWTFVCTDQRRYQEAEDTQRPLLASIGDPNPGMVVVDSTVSGDFMAVEVAYRRLGSQYFLKRDGDRWKVLFDGQAGIKDCELLDQAGVPTELYKQCWIGKDVLRSGATDPLLDDTLISLARQVEEWSLPGVSDAGGNASGIAPVETDASWWVTDAGWGVLLDQRQRAYTIELAVDSDKYELDPNVVQLTEAVDRYLIEQGFTSDLQHSYTASDRGFYEYLAAYRRDHVLCRVELTPTLPQEPDDQRIVDVRFGCIDQSDIAAAQAERDPFMKALGYPSGTFVGMGTPLVIGDNAVVSLSNVTGIRTEFFKLRQDGSWQVLEVESTNDGIPFCEDVDREQVPAPLYRECIMEDGQYRQADRTMVAPTSHNP